MIDRKLFPPLSAEERATIEAAIPEDSERPEWWLAPHQRLAVRLLAQLQDAERHGSGTVALTKLRGKLADAEARAEKAEAEILDVHDALHAECSPGFDLAAGVAAMRRERDRLLDERRDLAASIQALPFTPDTHTGTRQAAMREAAARLAEGGQDASDVVSVDAPSQVAGGVGTGSHARGGMVVPALQEVAAPVMPEPPPRSTPERCAVCEEDGFGFYEATPVDGYHASRNPVPCEPRVRCVARPPAAEPLTGGQLTAEKADALGGITTPGRETFETWHARECPALRLVQPCIDNDDGRHWLINGNAAKLDARFSGRTCREVFEAERTAPGSGPAAGALHDDHCDRCHNYPKLRSFERLVADMQASRDHYLTERNEALAEVERLKQKHVEELALCHRTIETADNRRRSAYAEVERLRGELLAAADERFRDVIGMGAPYTLADTIRILASAASHLLDAHSCDHEGYETIGYVRDLGARYVSSLEAFLRARGTVKP